MITPLLTPPRVNGGTLYTFPSAQRDVARVFTNDSYSFRFSRFACLNLKDMTISTNVSDNNLIYLNQATSEDSDPIQYGFPGYEPQGNDFNLFIAEHLQNYVMNYETAILNGEGDDDGYNNDIIRSPSERVFFNWLQKVNGIEFQYAETGTNLYYEKCGDLTYTPDDTLHHSDYVNQRTVKYIGNIDIINSVEIDGDVYSELYLHIPSTVGASYEVRFGTTTDDNYNGGDIVINRERIIGRDDGDEFSEYGLSNSAIYDIETPNTYTGDRGYVIDFRDTFYYNNSIGYYDISSMNELSAEDFEFNCVLIYYDFTNNGTGETVTNLYGVLFLEEITNTGGQLPTGYIQRYPKHKTTNLQNGNAFALKVDIKVDAYPTSTTYIETGDSDFENTAEFNTELLETFQEYLDDMTKLQQTFDIFSRQQTEIARLQNRISELEVLLYGVDTLSSVEDRVRDIEVRLNGSGIADQLALNGLISNINQKVDDFISEQNSPVSVVEGYGTTVTNEDGKVTIDLKNSTYNLNDLYEMILTTRSTSITDSSSTMRAAKLCPEPDFTKPVDINHKFVINHTDVNTRLNIYTTLEEGSNLAMLYVEGDPCTNNINLYVDDNDIKWKKGQTLKIIIRDYIDFNGHNLIIHTGHDGDRWYQNITIEGNEISTKPTIEIICTNDVMKQTETPSFEYDCSSISETNGGTSEGSAVIPTGNIITVREIERLVNTIIC